MTLSKNSYMTNHQLKKTISRFIRCARIKEQCSLILDLLSSRICLFEKVTQLLVHSSISNNRSNSHCTADLRVGLSGDNEFKWKKRSNYMLLGYLHNNVFKKLKGAIIHLGTNICLLLSKKIR